MKAYSVFADQPKVREATRNLVNQISANGDVKKQSVECEQKVAAAGLPERLRTEVMEYRPSTAFKFEFKFMFEIDSAVIPSNQPRLVL